MHKRKKEKKHILIKSVLLILLISVSLIGIDFYHVFKEKQIFNSLEKEFIDINEYTLYGTHLNIKGTLNKKLDNIKNINIVLKSFNKEINYNVSYKSNNKLTFSSSNNINEGINLENLLHEKYYILLKIELNDSSIKYYSLNNKTKYNKLTYYTITKNNSNNKIEIDYDKYKNKPYMFINVKRKNLPKDVYDIVIDPGHGGSDIGASTSEYTEADFTLKYSLALKESLEKKGYKIKLTRDKDITLNSYGQNGRAVIPSEVKAKYVFSIHLNSNDYTITKGGVEIYAPNSANLDFAKTIADNIVSMANTTYSLNKTHKIKNGVYVRTMSNNDINNSNESANNDGYKPYNITTDTPYLYMIRETGGIITKAYIDGRNKKYDANPYYNSNIGAEAYLLELGYIINDTDLKNLINNQDKYIEAITKSIDEHIKNNSN